MQEQHPRFSDLRYWLNGISDRALDNLVREVMPEVVRIRRLIHSHPELGFEETETSKVCAEALHNAGLDVMTGIARTGIVGTLRGARSGQTVALRADMDALPIPEETGLPFSSRVAGLMHACGHDGHVAIVLGAAMVLARLRDKLEGTVKFIFQPDEEGLGGAKEMISAGVLDNPRVDAIFALHLWPDIPFGHVGIHKGPAMAALDKVFIRIRGRGGHVATPHKGADALVAASLLVLAMQTLASREVDPLEPVVVGIGQLKAGRAHNTIADSAELIGTVRTLDPWLRQTMPRLIDRKVRGIAESTGVEYDFDYTFGCPPVINNPKVADMVVEVCKIIPEVKKVSVLTRPSMIGEDFAYYLQTTPGAMLLLGAGAETTGDKVPGTCVGDTGGYAGMEHRTVQAAYPLHHSRFDFPEEALAIGVKAMTTLVLRFLRQQTSD